MADHLLGRQLGNFRIEYLLGQGGMARVYYGTDVRLMRPVAIKILDERLQADQAYARRFVREAQTVAAWRHENVLQVYYADESDGIYYFIAEYIDGADLGKLLDEYTSRGEYMPHTDVLRIGHAIANALDFAHTQGVIHRDVKPANVLVERSGRVVLGDFGLALEVRQGTLGEVLGTPQYISPEQARHSAEAVPASDLYSLGVILYEMLTGAVPFDDPSPTTVALQHITFLPPPPRDVNPRLNQETERVLLKALSKKPADRYASGRDLLNALEEALSLLPSRSEFAAVLPSSNRETGERVRLSHLNVLEIIASRTPPTAELHQQPLPSQGPLNIPLPEAVHAAGIKDWLKRPSLRVSCSVLFILTLVGILFLQGKGSDLIRSGTGRQTPNRPVSLATEMLAEASLPPTQPGLTETVSPLNTDVNESVEIAESYVSPTSLPTDTQPPPVVEAAAAPTVKYPQGRHFRLFYNDNSFYIHNSTDERISIEPIAFERVLGTDSFSDRFEGFEWTKMYAYLWPKNCLKVEIRESRPYLSPSACLGYNASRTFERNESVIFWTSREGTAQFRVLWHDEEVARCEIADGECEVFLP